MGAFSKNFIFAIIIYLASIPAHADPSDSVTQDYLAASEDIYQEGMMLAQYSDDSYDPFSDYSEFEEITDEEADINFFRNGRFFTLGFAGGYRTWTETLGNLYSDSSSFGLFLSYFFDLRFALQMTFLTGSHVLGFTTPISKTLVRGDVSLTTFALDLKYYLNTQNVTRGLAKFNPYLIGGFSQNTRTVTVAGEDAFAKEGALGFDMGAGIELPMMRNKMYFGAQIMYQLINFSDENSEIVLASNESTGLYPTGDLIALMIILGINF